MASTPLIALQLYTVRDVLADDLDAGLKAVADIGYQYVELAGLHGTYPDTFRKKLDDLGLKAISAHIPLERVRDETRQVADEAKTLGMRFVMIPFLAESLRTPEGYAATAEVIARAEGHDACQGLTFGYHNHAFEFEKLDDGREGFDLIFNHPTPASELDVYWVEKGGKSALEYVHRLTGRVPLLHMKDMAADGGFAPVGTGTIDLQAIVKAAPAAGVEALIVEQDNGWPDNDPMASARVSFENLSKMVAAL